MPVNLKKKKKVSKEEHKKLLSLYNDLDKKILKLQRESIVLRKELYKIRDKKKMKGVLQNIIRQPD